MKTKKKEKAVKAVRHNRIAKAGTVARRFKMKAATIKAIRNYANVYGSQGRALQVATELLVRVNGSEPKPERKHVRFDPFVLPPDTGKTEGVVAMSYKLVPRTSTLIDQISLRKKVPRGRVLEACVAVLHPKLTVAAFLPRA